MINLLKKIRRKLVDLTINKFPEHDPTIYLRYKDIAEYINFNNIPRILEIGSGELGIIPYLKKDIVIDAVDVDFGNKSKSKNMNMFKVTKSKLPFANEVYDLVFSVDTLEHISPKNRKQAIEEMLRVGKYKIYLSFPTGVFSSLSDSILDKYYSMTHKGQRFSYLSEHKDYGLPKAKEVINIINRWSIDNNRKLLVKSKGNTNILIWVLLLLLGFSEKPFFTTLYKLSIWITPVLSFFNVPPYYRQMIEITISKK